MQFQLHFRRYSVPTLCALVLYRTCSSKRRHHTGNMFVTAAEEAEAPVALLVLFSGSKAPPAVTEPICVGQFVIKMIHKCALHDVQ